MKHTLLETRPPCYLHSHSCGDGAGTAQVPAAPTAHGANVSGMTSLPGMVAL